MISAEFTHCFVIYTPFLPLNLSYDYPSLNDSGTYAPYLTSFVVVGIFLAVNLS